MGRQNSHKMTLQLQAAIPPRRIEAAIEDKFQKRDEQIQLVRENADKEIGALRVDISKLENMIDARKIQLTVNHESRNHASIPGDGGCLQGESCRCHSCS